jgi:ferredoxin-type protein NapH
MSAIPAVATRTSRGWWRAHQWLILRRATQASILLLFLIGPWLGVWIVKGNLSASLVLDTVPLTDPYVFVQTLAAGHPPVLTATLGAALVAVFYFLVGGRAFCAWVCPVNVVTDAAAWTRDRLGVKSRKPIQRATRYWLLLMTLTVPLAIGYMAWELLNPVSLLHRGLIFGMSWGWSVIGVIFLLDLFVTPRGWCGHLCPMGAFYGVIGAFSPTRIEARYRERCNDCMDCFKVCPEPQVIPPALKGGKSRVITASACTNCGRCIDVCKPEVFKFSFSFSPNSHS